MPRSKGHTGRRYRRLREHVKRHQSVCAICGRPIDMALTYPHPYSFSLEHTQPVSKREDLALRRTNATAAHLRCNQSKGNRPHAGPQPSSQDW